MLSGTELPALPEQASTAITHDKDLLRPKDCPSPPPGSTALAIFHDSSPHVVHYQVLGSDVLMVGREDAAKGVFPDLDLSLFLNQGVGATHVSREHLRITARDGHYFAEALPGTTGTQWNKAILPPQERVQLSVGDRLILGARVRLKLMSF